MNEWHDRGSAKPGKQSKPALARCTSDTSSQLAAKLPDYDRESAYTRRIVTRADWRAIVVVLLALALTMFAGEAIHELHYAGAHPSGYGPANVIALACAAGAVLALAAGIAIFVAPPTTAMPRWCVPAVLVAIGLGVWLVTVSAAVPESSSLGTFPYNDGSPLGN